MYALLKCHLQNVAKKNFWLAGTPSVPKVRRFPFWIVALKVTHFLKWKKHHLYFFLSPPNSQNNTNASHLVGRREYKLSVQANLTVVFLSEGDSFLLHSSDSSFGKLRANLSIWSKVLQSSSELHHRTIPSVSIKLHLLVLLYFSMW